MEGIQEKKLELRNNASKMLQTLSDKVLSEKTSAIENRLFDFANFIEANISLLYLNSSSEVSTTGIIKRCLNNHKIIVLPAYDLDKPEIKLMKIENLDTDLTPGPTVILEPDANRCKVVPVECIDIAVIPGILLDEKGGRMGSGDGYYDRLIPHLPATTRKVALAFESQIVQQVPMEPHDKHVDIIITEERIIYKI